MSSTVETTEAVGIATAVAAAARLPVAAGGQR